MTIRKGSYVRGRFSPFVHGQVVAREGAFLRLDNGDVYPYQSLVKSSKKVNQQLPDFGETLRASVRGLNLR